MGFFDVFLPIEWILIAILLLFFLIQLAYYLFFYNWILVRNKKNSAAQLEYTEEKQSVSVVVYSSNDADNLERFLPKILSQNYPSFEVIVVNDGSTDETNDVLKRLGEAHSNLYYTTIPEDAKNHSRRKLAMSVGIKAAKFDWIITTEANCEVLSDEWISSIARNFTATTDVVLLYSTFDFPENIKSILRSLNNLYLGLRYLGMAIKGRPYMGIRRNLAYRKELYFRNRGGFSGYLYLRDGDDDLFINRIAVRENTRVEASSESITKAYYYNFDKSWKENKQSYAITSSYLERNGSLIFGFESLTRYVFYVGIILGVIAGFFDPKLYIVVLPIFIIRLIIQAFIINKSAVHLCEKRFLFSLIIYDIVQPVVDMYYKISGRLSKKR